jgi:hypothetical protein
MRYIVMARWWNGKDWDMTKKEIDTKDKVIGAVKLLLKETNPYQISITDTSGDQWKELTKTLIKGGKKKDD